jgi:ADP-ribose pyrophosphatase YjhB (NUDIX family)
VGDLDLRREYPNQPIVGVGALIVDEGKLVLIKRGVEPRKGKWSIPGGAVELGEKVRDAVVREAEEESGLKVEIVTNRPLDTVDNIIEDENKRLQYHYVLLQFITHPKSGTLNPGGDALEAKWVLFSEVETYDLTDSFRSFFKEHQSELVEF